MHTELSFSCPKCEQPLAASQEHSGMSFDCPTYTTELLIPPAGISNALAVRPNVHQVDAGGQAHLPTAHLYRSDATPVELHMPGQLGSLKTKVDQPTSNAMVTTFLGGALVATGAVLFAMFGGNGKSS